MKRELNKQDVLKALKVLDTTVAQSFELIIAGGAAMMCSYKFPFGTVDVDVVVKRAELHEVDKYIKKTAGKLNMSPDWMNMWVSSFTHYLPMDYEKRLNIVFKGKKLTAKAFGKEDMLILKCFAHRGKDVSHAKALIKQKADIAFVEKHIKKLIKKNVPLAQKSLDFLYDILDEMDL